MLRPPFAGHRRYSITHRAVQRLRELVHTLDESDDEALRDRLDEALVQAEHDGKAIHTLDAKLGEPRTLIAIATGTGIARPSIRASPISPAATSTVIGGASSAQQCLRAGLVDELHVDIMPVLLGEGLRLFENLGPEPIELEKIKVLEHGGRTSFRFRVLK